MARNVSTSVGESDRIRAVTGDTALYLAHFFGTSPELWLYLQKLYELRIAEKKADRGIRAMPTLKGRQALGA